MEALLAGVVVLIVYLREIDMLYARAEMTAVEREHARGQLERARNGLAIAVDAADMGNWELDLQTDLISRTFRHDQMFGYQTSQPHWSRATLLEHVVPEDRDAAAAAVERACIQGRLDAEFRIRRAGDGAIRWIAMRGRTSYDVAGKVRGMSGIVMDTTQRQLADERARQAERMEVVGQLTGGVAHDFNNMLTVILGNLDLIGRRPADVEQVRRLAMNATHAARRSAEVTDKLLSFSRRQLVRTETVNVNRLITNLLPRLQQAAGATPVVLDLDPTVEPASLDPRQFETAVLNLVLNARDALLNPATNHGSEGDMIRVISGTVTGSAAGEHAHDPQAAAADGFVRVAVADNGCGMDQATAAKAFDPFFTTKQVGSGAGLGLSQVYGFARQARGNVQLESSAGRGTVVELLLPKARMSVMHDERAPARSIPERGPLRRASGREVVLVVEDEETVREMAVESLRELGYQVIEAGDAAAALALLRNESRIDLMFSDVVMPGGMNGVQLAVEARRLRPHLKVLLTSGYTALTDDRDVPPDVLLLPKPYRCAQLATQLRVVMAG